MYTLFKFFHLFFLLAWFAGLFYLPRIYVNLAPLAADSGEYRYLLAMAVRLFRFMTPLGIGALLCGLAVAAATGWWQQGWVHGKIALGAALAAYHLYCGLLLADFRHGRNRRSHRWYRVFNEIPVLLMAAAVYLAVYKPF